VEPSHFLAGTASTHLHLLAHLALCQLYQQAIWLLLAAVAVENLAVVVVLAVIAQAQ
jgi:hypothetical protein